MTRTIFPKDVNVKLYQTAKEIGQRQGKNMGDVLNESLRNWLITKTGSPLSEVWNEIEEASQLNNAIYEKERIKISKRKGDRYVLISSGEIQGFFDNLKDAAEVAIISGARQAIITKVGPRGPKMVDL